MDLNRSGIYQIRNVVNNRIYIGSTNNFKKRKNEHFRLLKKNDHDNKFLQNDFNKCGEAAFRFFIVEYCDENELIQYEQKWLDVLFDDYNQCYNICKTAAKPPCSKGNKHTLGYKHSAETRMKLSAGLKERWSNPDYKQKMIKRQKETWKNSEYRQKMSAVLKGKNAGSNHPNYDSTIYHFYNAKLNITENCTQFELRTKYKLNVGVLSNVVNINNKTKSHKGWTVIKT